MKAAIIQHPRMDEHVLIQIVGRDKAASAKIIEERTTARTSPCSGSLTAGRAGVSGRSTYSRSLITRPCSLVLSETVTTSPVRSCTRPNPVQCRPVKKHFFITDAHEPISLAFVLTDQLAFTDLHVIVYFLLPTSYFLLPASFSSSCAPAHHGAQRPKIAGPPTNRSMMMRFKAQEKGEKRAITCT